MKKKVLFLCTGNSCRSQMAEAIVNAKLGNKWKAYSAGTKPEGFVHPKALQVLLEIGINHNGKSKKIEDLEEKDFDLIITVCDSAKEQCPLWLGKGRKIHFSLPDPAKTDNIEDFRKVRDTIFKKIVKVVMDYS